MPSQLPLPQISDYLDASEAEIIGLRDTVADTHRGSGYDVHSGTSAVLFARQAMRDRDLFRASYFDTAAGNDLDTLILNRYGVPRIATGQGVGFATLTRPTASFGATTIWAGTRISVLVPGSGQRLVEVSSDTPVTATSLGAFVPVETTTSGFAPGFDVSPSDALLSLEDPLDDASWTIARVTVGAGTDREKDADYRARTKSLRRQQRLGYALSITNACIAAGATQIALFQSDYLGSDFGINRCFVGDASYQSTAALLLACRIAVDSARVFGADLTVFGMQQQLVTVQLQINLWTDPNSMNTDALTQAAVGGVANYFASRSNAFIFRDSGISGGVAKSLRTDLQSVTVSTTPAEPTLTTVFNTAPITRYFVTPQSVSVALFGPS